MPLARQGLDQLSIYIGSVERGGTLISRPFSEYMPILHTTRHTLASLLNIRGSSEKWVPRHGELSCPYPHRVWLVSARAYAVSGSAWDEVLTLCVSTGSWLRDPTQGVDVKSWCIVCVHAVRG